MKDCRMRLTFVGLFLACLLEPAFCADTGAGREYTGDFVLDREIPVNLAAGTAEHPRLVEVPWVRVEPVYANAWALTARVGWSPIADATWSIRVELLDDKGGILKHSRDMPTTFTGKADGSNQDAMHYADLSLDAMQWEMRKHVARIRVVLEPATDPTTGPSTDESAFHRLVVCVVDAGSEKPVPDAAVVANAILRGREYRSHTYLHRTNAQGECRVAFAGADLSAASVAVQKPAYAALRKYWSAPYFSRVADLPLVELPERHVIRMVAAQAVGGVVRDQAGGPVAGAQVSMEARLEESSGAAYVSRCVRTDEEGRWRVEGIPTETDTVSLGFKHPEYISDEYGRRPTTAEELSALRDLKHVATMEEGLTVSGRVLDDRGRPVPRAAVMLAPASGSSFRYDYADTLTDAAGRFHFGCGRNDTANTAPGGGSTGVLVEVPGYIPALQRVVVEPNLAPLEFRLNPGRALTVRVVDANDRPLAGANTVVHPLAEDPRYGLWLADTDEQGRFQVPHTPDSDVLITVLKIGYASVRDYGLPASRSEHVIKMTPAPRVRGTVRDARTGRPVPSLEVVPTFPDGRRMPGGNSCSFRDGRFELAFDEAPPDSLQLKILAIGYKPVTSESIPLAGTQTLEFKLEADPSFDAKALRREIGGPPSSEPLVITGTIVDPNGRPAPNVAISVHPLSVPETITNAEGKFKLRCSSRMMSSRQNEVPYLLARDRQRNLAVAVEFDPAETEDLTIQLVPGMILSGRVTDEQGKGIPGAKMSLVFWTAQMGYGMPAEAAQPDPNGRYEIRAVPPGHRYSVNATAGGYGQNYADARTAEAVDTRMELEPIVLRLADLDISGVVVDAEDKPVPHARVYCYGRGQPSQQVRTDAQGRFVIRGVCAGAAQIQANTETPTRLHGMVRTEGGATDVKIVVSPLGSRGQYVPARPPSLIGRPLPSPAGLGLESAADSARDRAVLLCFFDMNQRPSRYCLTTLARRADELKQKGVSVMAVQAGEVEGDALEQWLKEQGIALPVGSVRGDIQKTTFAWGVRSLPWLILTDAQHVVRAEGFAANELDARIGGTP